MSAQPEITRLDLHDRFDEIMDAVERGQAFTVTRDGHRTGELVPLRSSNGPKRFVSREEFMRTARGVPHIDVEQFRRDQDAVIDPEPSDPCDR